MHHPHLPQPATRLTAPTLPGGQHERWSRIGLGVRLAYNPWKPEVARYWVSLGMTLARDGVMDEVGALRQMLKLLVHTAQDEALPWSWRSICLECCARPLARLTTLLQRSDPALGQSLGDFMQIAQDEFAAVPPRARPLPL